MLIGARGGWGAPPAAAAAARPAGWVVADATQGCMIVCPNGQWAFVSAAVSRLRRGTATLPRPARSGVPVAQES